MAALAALAATAALAPAAVPIYDGIGNPDEPYRFVNPPANAKTTKAPTTATITVPIHSGVSAAEYANTAEQGPQLSLYLPLGSLQAPGGASTVTVKAEPKAPPTSPLPSDGTIVSNVYALSATAGSQPVSIIGTGRREPTLQMRSPDASQPGPVFEYRTTSGWKRAATIRVGVDIYQASVPTLGDWALVRLSSPESAGAGGSGVNWGLLGGGIALLVVALLIVMIRVRRTGAEAS